MKKLISAKPKKEAAPVFGVTLAAAVRQNAQRSRSGLPAVVEDCLAYLDDDEVIGEAGIFRKSGGAARINAFREAYDTGQAVSLSDGGDVHTVAGLLKLFLRELPTPMLGADGPQRMTQALGVDDAQREAAVVSALCGLDGDHLRLSCALLAHLSRVKACEANKMTAYNLAVVFSPTTRVPVEVLDYLIDHAAKLLPQINVPPYEEPPGEEAEEESDDQKERALLALRNTHLEHMLARLQAQAANEQQAINSLNMALADRPKGPVPSVEMLDSEMHGAIRDLVRDNAAMEITLTQLYDQISTLRQEIVDSSASLDLARGATAST
eukprot:comp76072_c0_seq1/m.48252 comp76072_c0_seq1/g.48252  ORF comp76072_c0_seq1/g.48252 comp76072_c0_seq1/m.48252 type:complete len:324 (-) comp76072_c0_seq1:369-1340(-)